MGQEVECRATWNGKKGQGKALLETEEVQFRGTVRFRLPFRSLTRVEAMGGALLLEGPGGRARIELGARAIDWAHRIRNPKGRVQKMNLRAGHRAALVGEMDGSFANELEAVGVVQVPRGLVDVVVLAADRASSLRKIPALVKRFAPAGALWVVYPKGRETFGGTDVLLAGRAAGLTDVKVVKFSETHTGLKFVVPLARR